MSTRRSSPFATVSVWSCVAVGVLIGAETLAQPGEPPRSTSPTSSLLAQAETATHGVSTRPLHGLRAVSMFALASPKVRVFQRHDLVQIVVRETASSDLRHRVDLEKDWDIKGAINAWPDFRVEDLLELIIRAGRSTDLPRLDLEFAKDFEGDGRYRREDDFTARLTAEVMDILPNGNLVLESRTRIKLDDEESMMIVTGICRPEDVTAANSILSNQMHDLNVERTNRGELKKTNEKGIIAKVFETIFAF